MVWSEIDVYGGRGSRKVGCVSLLSFWSMVENGW